MLKVIFYLKSKETSPELPIFAKVTLNGDTMAMSTGKLISRERWQQTNKLRNPLKLPREKAIKNSLDSLKLQLEEHHLNLVRQKGNVSLDNLKKLYKGQELEEEKPVGIIELFKKHNSFFAQKVLQAERSAASLQKYERGEKLIRDFIIKKYGVNDYPVGKIGGAFIYNLEAYLKFDSIYKHKKGIQNNSVVKYFRNFKTVCTFAVKREIIEKNPFDIYEGKLKINEAVYLTKKELVAIENKIIVVARLQRVRDLFLFSCYTGYAPIDALKLTTDNIHEDNDGNYWIRTTRTKTSIKANVPLLPPALKIIERYSGQQDTLLPKLSNQKMNAYLKEIADLCGIAKNMTWYVARHTFATTVTLANGIKIENVSAMLGHSNIKQTQHYAKVLDQSVSEDMAKLKQIYQ